MADRAYVVLDVGKTVSKLSLWNEAGHQLARETRPNARLAGSGEAVLDAAGIEGWLADTLASFAAGAQIEAIVPVAHGAAAALIAGGRLKAPPGDYEQPIPADERARYDRQRDPFAETGSPALPNGLNLGAQLHAMEAADREALRGATILPWAQYWAWRLSGIASSEVTSLGCHSDLWRPFAGTPSALSTARGWADRMAPLRTAGETLAEVTAEWAGRCGLPRRTRILCGLHDTNAALLAARSFPEIADRPAAVLSTGTWFVAMQSNAPAGSASHLAEDRDCLVNVDVAGRPLPSARFMGGREIELLAGPDAESLVNPSDQVRLLAALDKVLRTGTMALPTFTAGCGPFPTAQGRWSGAPADGAERSAAAALYAALMADTALDLIGAGGNLLVEGRFARSDLLVRCLAALRPDMSLFVADTSTDVAFGALRLMLPTLAPATPLRRVEPLDRDLSPYRDRWRAEAAAPGSAARPGPLQ